MHCVPCPLLSSSYPWQLPPFLFFFFKESPFWCPCLLVLFGDLLNLTRDFCWEWIWSSSLSCLCLLFLTLCPSDASQSPWCWELGLGVPDRIPSLCRKYLIEMRTNLAWQTDLSNLEQRTRGHPSDLRGCSQHREGPSREKRELLVTRGF